MDMVLSFALLLGWSTPAWANDPPPDPVAEPASSDAAAALEDARRSYLLGDHEGARLALQRLVARAGPGSDVPPDVEAEAWIYLGEMQYLGGDREGADASFRLVLQRNPDQPISPYDHPLEVVGAFELVRTAVQSERRATARIRKPMPWWGYAPLGIPQFKQGKPVRGAVYATLQTGFAAASVTAWVLVDAEARDVRDESLALEERQAALQRARTLRDALSFTSAAAFYVTWGASVADSGASWRKTRLAPSGVGVAPAPGGASVALSWRF